MFYVICAAKNYTAFLDSWMTLPAKGGDLTLLNLRIKEDFLPSLFTLQFDS